MITVDLNDITQIPGGECLGDSRARINDNVYLLKDAIAEMRTMTPYATAVSFLGVTTASSITADNTFIEVVIGGTTKYLRLYDVI